MERIKWPALLGLVAGTILLSRSLPTTFASDKPVHTSIVLLASCAAAVIALSRFLPTDGGRSHDGQRYDALPLGEFGQPHSSRQPSPSPEDVRYPSSLRKLRILFLILVIAICLRVEILRKILANTQCADLGWGPLIPIALALLDYLAVQRHRKQTDPDDPESSVYDALEDNAARSPYRYIATSFLLGFGSMVALSTASSPESTYICAASLPNGWLVPTLQRFGTLMDLAIIYCIDQLLHQHEGKGSRSISLRFMSVGWALLFSAIILSVISVVYYIVQEADRRWMLTLSSLYVWGVLGLNALLCFTAICTLLTVSATMLPIELPTDNSRSSTSE